MRYVSKLKIIDWLNLIIFLAGLSMIFLGIWAHIWNIPKFFLTGLLLIYLAVLVIRAVLDDEN